MQSIPSSIPSELHRQICLLCDVDQKNMYVFKMIAKRTKTHEGLPHRGC